MGKIIVNIKQECRKLLEEGSSLSEQLIMSLVHLYVKDGEPLEALDALEHLLLVADTDEELAFYCFHRGQLLEKTGDHEAAAHSYRNALAFGSVRPALSYFSNNCLGYCLIQIGEIEAAEERLQEALKIAPGRHHAWTNLGIAHAIAGELQRAVGCFIKATEICPADSSAFQNLEMLLAENPVLRVDNPGLDNTVEECREAVELAKKED
jgi:Flp pilus assembly protein TadD